MRRTAMWPVIASAILFGGTACGGTPSASPSPSESPRGVIVIETPITSPLPTVTALTAAELTLCGVKKTPYTEVFMKRALYAGFVNGNYNGGAPAMRKVLAELKQDVSAYQAYLKAGLGKATTERLQAAIKSDIAAWAKHSAALKAAGADYKGKVYKAVENMQLLDGSDDQLGEVCNPR